MTFNISISPWSQRIFPIIIYHNNLLRLVAFRVSLPKKGEQDLRDVLSKRFRRLAKRLKDFQVVSNADRDEVNNVQNIEIIWNLTLRTLIKCLDS